MPRNRRRLLIAGLGLVALLAVAIPTLAAAPNAAKAERGAGIAVTVRGTVAASKDDQDRPEFTLTVGGTTWTLSAGPKWFFGEDGGPLAAFVGESVTIVGTHREGQTDLDVDSVNGTALRSDGRPPWAGGPKVLGEAHPGSRGAGNGNGADTAPGQVKKASPAP